MDVVTAREVMTEAVRLAEHTARFQAKYGRFYTLKPGSPADAWALYQDILSDQCRIATLLDDASLEQLHHRCGAWWAREDVIDTGVVRELMAEVGNLLTCCAYFEASQDERDWSYAVQLSQRTIAGMLHPTSLQLAGDEKLRSPRQRYAS
ncbi:MAG: hypothetical protein SF029_13020 [bacterium]|nr:hypothetical protein [bacterium]